ncbi:sec-independent translocation protein mttA/Hcf106 [Rubrobacter xylanophilus DSM 9941]|uniref:Sec-independent translocation protein mttA/Hcf106 n=1 Tax=Rubrobacter xylanophilus (strain DSM 9941 / JCM 11954 / NBRC 16129 / PRD-1) TaxID=266117 RepID=Q1AUJ4_RUBXD|nr:twin-arginine translocase TatA/TatE family subunit [Rubrobacter xylanophilus]ABG04934.1 sec-independent translocation protein mttA/Hcf106 [Rubrobacter xylanophilus DSM 9941]
MFGVGPQEIVIIGLLVLIIFGPSKLPQMARDFGRFVGEARRSIDEFKEELTAGYEEEDEPPSRKKGRERDL